MKTGIHQPNFLPWIGYFDRMVKSEQFIYFDHVQRPNGKSWLTRVKALNRGSEIWLTLPIKRKGRSFERISEAMLDGDSDEIFRSVVNKIESYYHKAPFRKEVMSMLGDSYKRSDRLADFNIALISGIAEALGIKASARRSSEFFREESTLLGSKMILETCKRFGVTEFVCGGYAVENLVDIEDFRENGVEVSAQGFLHPVYRQEKLDTCVEGMSIIDLLMNRGIAGSAILIKENAQRMTDDNLVEG